MIREASAMDVRTNTVDIDPAFQEPELRDPNDHIIVATCRTGDSDALISRDEDLLALNAHIVVESPATFSARL